MKSPYKRRYCRPKTALSLILLAIFFTSAPSYAQDDTQGFLGAPPGAFLSKGAKPAAAKSTAAKTNAPKTSTAKIAPKTQSPQQTSSAPLNSGQNFNQQISQGGGMSDWTQPSQSQSQGVGMSDWTQPSQSQSQGASQSALTTPSDGQSRGLGQSEWTQPSGQSLPSQNSSPSQGLSQSGWTQPSGGAGQAFSGAGQSTTVSGGTQQAPLFGQVLEQEQASNNGGLTNNGGMTNNNGAMQGSVVQSNAMQSNGMASVMAGMGGMPGAGTGQSGIAGMAAGMLGSMMTGGMSQGNNAGMAGMMNFLQKVMPGAANTMQPNMSTTPGFPAPGSLGTLGGGTSSGGDAGFSAPGSLGTLGTGASSGGDAGFPAPGSLGPLPGTNNGTSAAVPMGTGTASNFVQMGQTKTVNNIGNNQAVRAVSNTVNRAGRQAGSAANYMINNALYRTLYGIRF